MWKVRCNPGMNWSGMDAILIVHMLSEGLQEPDREFCQIYQEIVDRR